MTGATGTTSLRLLIGSDEAHEGWVVFDIQGGPNVDHVGDCRDLGRFGDDSFEIVYASHVYEHLSYKEELIPAFREVHRVLRPGGRFLLGVPDLEALCRLFIDPQRTADERYYLMRAIFGGQMDAHDYHKAGFSFDILARLLGTAGFSWARRVEGFGLFKDCTELEVFGARISLNVEAIKQ